MIWLAQILEALGLLAAILDRLDSVRIAAAGFVLLGAVQLVLLHPVLAFQSWLVALALFGLRGLR